MIISVFGAGVFSLFINDFKMLWPTTSQAARVAELCHHRHWACPQLACQRQARRTQNAPAHYLPGTQVIAAVLMKDVLSGMITNKTQLVRIAFPKIEMV